MLATAGWDGAIRLWEIPSGRLIQTIAANMDRSHRLVWSRDGRYLAGAGTNKTIWIWDSTKNAYHSTLRGHTDAVTSLAFTPDGQRLLSGGDNSLRVWDVASGQCVRIMQGHAATLFDVTWSPDCARLASGGSDAQVSVYSRENLEAPRLWEGHRGRTFGVAWHPEKEWLASSSWDMRVLLRSLSEADAIQELTDPDDANTIFYSLAWSPDGTRLAGAAYLNVTGVLIWEFEGANVRSYRRLKPPQPERIRHAVWGADSSCLTGAGDDGQIFIWDVEDGALVHQLNGHQTAVQSIAWSPDGVLLASGSRGNRSGELAIWDPRREQRLVTLEGHPEIVYSLAWGADREYVISGGDDSCLRWWHVPSGECRHVVNAHQGMVQALRRSPDGKMLASAGVDGAVRIWDIRSGEAQQTLRRDRPYERLNITGLRGVTEAQKSTLYSLGAISQDDCIG